MNNTQIILALLNLGLQAASPLIADLLNLIHGNPMLPTETPADYVARLKGQIIAIDVAVQAQDAEIQR